LKGCTTFRFNPEAFQGVLVKEQDLKNTVYKFTLDDGTIVEARGDEEIEYDGEKHTAANLYDALKEGGKFIIYQVTNELKQHATHFERAESEYFLQNIPPMFITVFQKTHLLDGHKRGTLQGASFSVSAHRSA